MENVTFDRFPSFRNRLQQYGSFFSNSLDLRVGPVPFRQEASPTHSTLFFSAGMVSIWTLSTDVTQTSYTLFLTIWPIFSESSISMSTLVEYSSSSPLTIDFTLLLIFPSFILLPSLHTSYLFGRKTKSFTVTYFPDSNWSKSDDMYFSNKDSILTFFLLEEGLVIFEMLVFHP